MSNVLNWFSLMRMRIDAGVEAGFWLLAIWVLLIVTAKFAVPRVLVSILY